MSDYKAFSNLEAEDWERLAEQAMAVQSKAHVPYSEFRVGAALMLKDGTVVTGVNVENATYGATVCAERTAVGTAVATGFKEYRALAVVTDAELPVAPCGICRQVLAEFCEDLPIVMISKNGDVEYVTLAELLPHRFGSSDFRDF